jgi:hypothetical protein
MLAKHGFCVLLLHAAPVKIFDFHAYVSGPQS